MISLSFIIELLSHYKYAFLLPVAAVEGPIISILGGFLASTGHLNIFLVYVVVVLGDLIGDTAYYMLGRMGGRSFAQKHGKLVGITEQRLVRLESHFKDHAGKTLVIGKFSHGLGAVVLFAAGMGRVTYPKFAIYNLWSTGLKSLILVIAGYYYGYAYQRINDYFGYASYFFIGLAGIIVIAYILVMRRVRRELL